MDATPNNFSYNQSWQLHLQTIVMITLHLVGWPQLRFMFLYVIRNWSWCNWRNSKWTFQINNLEPTTRILRCTDRIFYRYLYSYFNGNKFTDGLTDRNSSSIKLSSIIFNILAIKFLTDFLTKKVQKNYMFHFIGIFLGNFFI